MTFTRTGDAVRSTVIGRHADCVIVRGLKPFSRNSSISLFAGKGDEVDGVHLAPVTLNAEDMRQLAAHLLRLAAEIEAAP